jgi:hypothetical protein
MRVTLATLRGEAPEFSWAAERSGFSWRYIGTRGSERVSVYCCAVLVGEDDFATKWYADDGECARSYVAWWLAQDFGRGREAGT